MKAAFDTLLSIFWATILGAFIIIAISTAIINLDK